MATTRKKKEQTYELRYTGCLTGAPTIYLHYGTENWSDISEVKMRKLKSCYKTEITVPATADINFCFRDANGNIVSSEVEFVDQIPSNGSIPFCISLASDAKTTDKVEVYAYIW